MTSSYTYQAAPRWTSVNPRSFYPLHEHPEPLEYPHLPTPPRIYGVGELYTLSTHIVPAAYPRAVPDIPVPKVPEHTRDREERKRRVLELVEDLAERQFLFGRGQLLGEPSKKVIWNCINRYARKTPRADNGIKGITLFLAHANGFPKEIWETTLKHLFSFSAESLVDEVWSFEAVQHGDSALVNANHLSGIYEWMDNSRDIANFLLNYMPSSVSDMSLPTNLPRIPRHMAESRIQNGFETRTLVVAGHSFGGCTSVLAALQYPSLFSSMILIDPVIVQPYDGRDVSFRALMVGAIQRRDRWSSREEALRLFQANPFFAAWDPDVLQLYVQYGLAEASDGSVKLKTPAIHEALCFADQLTRSEAWELIEKLDKNIELRWIVPGKSTDKGIHGEEPTRVRVWRRPENSSNIVIHSAGHLIVQESPRELAREIHNFVQRKYGRNPMKAQL